MRNTIIAAVVAVGMVAGIACSGERQPEPVVVLLDRQTEVGHFPLSEALDRASELAGFDVRAFANPPSGYELEGLNVEAGPPGFDRPFVHSSYRHESADEPVIGVQQSLPFSLGHAEPVELGLPGIDVAYEETNRGRAYAVITEDTGYLVTVLKPGGPSDGELRAAIRSLFE